MYYVSVLINNRKYEVVNLLPDNMARPEPPITPTFIIDRNPGEEKLLFSIDDQVKVVFRGGFPEDHSIDWSQLSGALEEGTLHLELAPLQKQKTATERRPVKGDLRIKEDVGRHYFSVSGKYRPAQVQVSIRFVIDGHAFAGQFVIHLVPQKQIFDVVMDFGSEASQIVFHQRGGGGSETLHRTRIVEKLVEYFYPQFAGAALHQRVADSELYSSQFFARKSDAVFEPTSPAGTYGSDELLNLLTDQRDVYNLANTHMFVSNLKLAHLGAYHQEIQFKSTDSNMYGAEHKIFDEIVIDLQQAVINYFIQMVLNDLKKSHSKGSRLYLSIRLLVPNVFDQQKVALMVNQTYRGLAAIVAKNPGYPLAGWEVNTISESDASFLGFKREKEEESRKTGKPYWVTDKDYLIIDAGKGTIDFSILRLSRKNQLTSIFRSGFIGAGNVISYAFVDTIFTALFTKKKEERQKAIYAICLAPHADMVAKLAFMQLIEQFKQHYDQSKNIRYRPLSQLIPPETLQDIRNEYHDNPGAPNLLSQIVDALKVVQARQSSIQDEFGMINDTVEAMVQKVEDEVRYSGFYDPERIEKIILTGRGFMFKRLEQAIAQKFKNPVDTTSDLKKICLTGAFSGDRINFDSNLVGYPTVYKFVSTSARQQVKEIDKGENKPLERLQVRNSIFRKTTDVVQEIIQKTVEANKKMADLLGNDHDEFAEPADALIHEGASSGGAEEFFLKGQFFENFNPDMQTITVCGIDYKRHNIGAGRINVFFTGSEFIVRSSKSYSPLGVYPRFFEETQWVFQTLYPFLEVKGPWDVKVVKEFPEDIEMEF